MAKNAVIHASNLQRAFRRSPLKVTRATAQTFETVKDEWVADARDIAPLDTGNLRRQIHGKSDATKVEIYGTAYNRGFDYGLYIHEHGSHLHLHKPGTRHKFLDESIDERKVEAQLEEAIENALRGVGW